MPLAGTIARAWEKRPKASSLRTLLSSEKVSSLRSLQRTNSSHSRKTSGNSSSHSRKTSSSSSSHSRRKIRLISERPSPSSPDALASTELNITCSGHSSAPELHCTQRSTRTDIDGTERDLRRSSGAISVESDSSEELAELARSLKGSSSTTLSPEEREALEYLEAAAVNRRRGSAWVDFSSDGTEKTQTANQRRATALWSQKEQLSWLDLQDILGKLIDEDDDEGSPEESGVGGGGEIWQQPMTKNVCFAKPSYNTVHETISMYDMTKDELMRCWYDEHDHERLQIDAAETINFFRYSHCVQARGKIKSDVERQHEEDNKWCSRGLDHVISEADYVRREERKLRVKAAVLAEQEAQRYRDRREGSKNGRNRGNLSKLGFLLNPEAIAKASMAISVTSIEEALTMGVDDAAKAKLAMMPIMMAKMRNQTAMSA